MDTLVPGERVEIVATDPGFSRDAAAWCNSTGNKFISKDSTGGKSVVVIEKGEPQACNLTTTCDSKGKTLIMFSDDLDKALATFVLANGAAATGQKVTIFFTFWGLNVIKKLHKPKVEKDIFGKMFGTMLPSSAKTVIFRSVIPVTGIPAGAGSGERGGVYCLPNVDGCDGSKT